MGLISHVAHAHIHRHIHTCIHTLNMHTKPLDLPISGLDVPAGSTAVSTLPLCLPLLLALSVLRFHLQPSRSWETLWQGDLGHLDGDGGRGGKLCENCAKVKEMEKGRKIWTVLVFRGPCKHKAAPSFIFQCHLSAHTTCKMVQICSSFQAGSFARGQLGRIVQGCLPLGSEIQRL